MSLSSGHLARSLFELGDPGFELQVRFMESLLRFFAPCDIARNSLNAYDLSPAIHRPRTDA